MPKLEVRDPITGEIVHVWSYREGVERAIAFGDNFDISVFSYVKSESYKNVKHNREFQTYEHQDGDTLITCECRLVGRFCSKKPCFFVDDDTAYIYCTDKKCGNVLKLLLRNSVSDKIKAKADMKMNIWTGDIECGNTNFYVNRPSKVITKICLADTLRIDMDNDCLAIATELGTVMARRAK